MLATILKDNLRTKALKMRNRRVSTAVDQFHLKGDSRFPNSNLPVLLYKGILDIPFLFPIVHVKNLFKSNGWSNAWDNGIYEYHHYHSITHEVLGIYRGKTTLLLGGEKGIKINVEKGDVLVIPAGVAHKNLGKAEDIKCIGAYPDGMEYDMNYGKPGERPKTDKNIKHVAIPKTDPVKGENDGLTVIWNE